MPTISCAYCSGSLDKSLPEINRAKKINAPLYCNRTCAGMGRRNHKDQEQKKKEKSEYDRKYREERLDIIKQRKAEYHKKTYDKEQAAIVRQKRMPHHVEYCRSEKYKKWKKNYDRKYRAHKLFGEMWEAALVLEELFENLDNRQIKQQQKLVNKSQNRKKQWKNLQRLT